METLNLLAEYGTLVIFTGAAVAIESMRQAWKLPDAWNKAIVTAEVVSAVTMIVPKAIRAVGEIVQVLGIALHDGAYAVRHGSRRPRETAGEGK